MKTRAVLWMIPFSVSLIELGTTSATWGQNRSSSAMHEIDLSFLQAKSNLTDPEVARLVTASSVLIWLNGKPNGSGWVYEVSDSHITVITNHHVVDVNGEVLGKVDVSFPEWDNRGNVIKTLSRYDSSKRRVGQVIDSHPTRDLAIIHVKGRVNGIRSLPLAKASAKRGEKIHTVGGNPLGSQAVWIYHNGTVRSVYHHSATFGSGQRVSAKKLETTQPSNGGDSGAAVVNQQGKLVGVVSSGVRHAPATSDYDPSNVRFKDVRLINAMTHCIDVSEVRKYMEEVKRYAVEPKTLSERINRAAWQTTKGNTALALVDIERVLATPGGYARLSNEWYKWLTRAYISSNRVDTGLQHLTAAIEEKPTEASLYSYRSELNLAKRHLDQAADDYARGKGARPETAEFHWHRFSLLDKPEVRRLGSRHLSPESDISRAIELDPSCAAYRLARAGTNSAVDYKLRSALRYRRENKISRLEAHYEQKVKEAVAKYRQTVNDYCIGLFAEPDHDKAWRSLVYLVGDHGLLGDRRADLAVLINNRAWTLATSDDLSQRDGERAIQLARKACWITDWNNAKYLDTLAAAYAEDGQLDKAVEWQQKATDMISSDHKSDFQGRLQNYQQRLDSSQRMILKPVTFLDN